MLQKYSVVDHTEPHQTCAVQSNERSYHLKKKMLRTTVTTVLKKLSNRKQYNGNLNAQSINYQEVQFNLNVTMYGHNNVQCTDVTM